MISRRLHSRELSILSLFKAVVECLLTQSELRLKRTFLVLTLFMAVGFLIQLLGMLIAARALTITSAGISIAGMISARNENGLKPGMMD